jgi:hypothetical protein
VQWRRALGAVIMFAGTIMLAGVTWAATMLVAGAIQAGSEFNTVIGGLALLVAPLCGGVAVLVGGRFVYGFWREAAPIANVTGEITCTVGLLAAIGMGGLLLFLLLSGFEREDTPAAVALGIGAMAGILLAQFGLSLRSRRYLD